MLQYLQLWRNSVQNNAHQASLSTMPPRPPLHLTTQLRWELSPAPAYRYTCPKNKRVKTFTRVTLSHSDSYYTCSCLTVHYSTNLECRLSIVSPLSSWTIKGVFAPCSKVKITVKKISQKGKIWHKRYSS